MIIERMKAVFAWIEREDLRVGDLWLNPQQVVELGDVPGWYATSSRAVREATLESKGAEVAGFLWGARVFESSLVPVNHIAAVPADLDARLVGGAACRPF
jgi:hypothetical protein